MNAHLVPPREEAVAGFSPEVSACSDYADGLGHLTTSGAATAAAKIGSSYAGK